MSTYTIGEAAQRSGFTTSSLRYYERIGLVAPSTRTPAGYRLYEDPALDRLDFISRAKQLGCSLEEITDLVTIWEGDNCGPVQRRLHDLVTARIADAQRQIAELTEFVAQLETAATQLVGPPTDGPCGPGCACMGDTTAPIVCTIGEHEVPGRVELLERLRTNHTRRRRTANGLELAFPNRPEIDADVRRFAVEEKRCCAFWRFDVTVDDDLLVLHWDGPPDGRDIVERLDAYFAGEAALESALARLL